MKPSILLFCLTIGIYSLAQSPSIEWEKTLGGGGTDIAYSTEQTVDGGYVVVGSSNSSGGDITGHHGGVDYWVVKTDAYGEIEWQKSLGGSGIDDASSIQQTSDGGYIVAGRSDSNDGDVIGGGGNYYKAWIVKLDSLGNIQWQKSIGDNNQEFAFSIKQTSDEGYIFSGAKSSNGWVVKLDASGNIIWENHFNEGHFYSNFSSVEQTLDGGYIVAGSRNTNPNYHSTKCWLVKLNQFGNMEWEKSGIGLHYGDYQYFRSVQQVLDGGYIAAGVISLYGNGTPAFNDNYLVSKFDSEGNVEWNKTFGGIYHDIANSVQQTMDGGYVVVGIGKEDMSNNDWLIVRLDSSGNMKWEKSLGGEYHEHANSVQQTLDGGFIIAGDIENENGKDYWLVKLGADLSLEDVNQAQDEILIYPNPVKNTLNFSEKVKDISVVDFSGNVLKTNDKITQELDISNLPKGTYLIKGLTEKGQKFSNKIVKN